MRHRATLLRVGLEMLEFAIVGIATVVVMHAIWYRGVWGLVARVGEVVEKALTLGL